MAALSLTYNLANGTTGDADQVMQNLTDIKNYVNTSTIRTDGVNTMTADLLLASGVPSAAAAAVRKDYMNGPFVEGGPATNQAFAANVYSTVLFPEVVDSHAAYVPGTGVFTAPTAGVYRVEFCFEVDGSNTHILRGRVKYGTAGASTRTLVAEIPNNATAGGLGSSEWRVVRSTVVKVAAGDTIEVQATNSAGDAMTLDGYLVITWLHG